MFNTEFQNALKQERAIRALERIADALESANGKPVHFMPPAFNTEKSKPSVRLEDLQGAYEGRYDDLWQHVFRTANTTTFDQEI